MLIRKENIDNGRAFDWCCASENYAKYRDIYPDEFYKRIVDLGYCTKNQKVLDLGTGTGVLPRNLYKYGAEWIGTDISKNQIKYAEQLSMDMDIKYIVSSAENIDFSDETFDVVTACQCFMYFDKNIILPKLHRILKNEGHFLILYMVWLPYESNIAKRSEDLVLKYNPQWSGGGMRRDKSDRPDWLMNLFEVSDSIAYDIDVSFTRESWNGRMKACRGIDASLPQSKIEAFEREHLNYLNTVPERFIIPHYATIMDLKKI